MCVCTNIPEPGLGRCCRLEQQQVRDSKLQLPAGGYVCVFQVCSMGVSCHEAHDQQQQVCTRLLPARLPAHLCLPSLQDLCRAPSPGEKGRAPGRAEPPRQPGPVSWSPRALAQLLPGSIWSQGRGGKSREVSVMVSLQAELWGQPNPEPPLTSSAIPIPESPRAPWCWCCTDVVSTTKRMYCLGGATCSSGPQHTFVPCLVTRTLAAPFTH